MNYRRMKQLVSLLAPRMYNKHATLIESKDTLCVDNITHNVDTVCHTVGMRMACNIMIIIRAYVKYYVETKLK